MFVLIGRDFLRKSQQDLVAGRTRVVGDGEVTDDFHGSIWFHMGTIVAQILEPGWDSDKSSSILVSICEGKRNCLLAIFSFVYSSLAVLRLHEGLV